MSAETMTDSDRAIEILEKTNDGKLLFQTPEQVERYGRNGDGWQLALVQDAVNHHLNEKGVALFAALHRQVMAGDYRYPLKEFIAKHCPELA